MPLAADEIPHCHCLAGGSRPANCSKGHITLFSERWAYYGPIQSNMSVHHYECVALPVCFVNIIQ